MFGLFIALVIQALIEREVRNKMQERKIETIRLLVTDFGEPDCYQAQGIVGSESKYHNILILQQIILTRFFLNDFI